MSVEEKRIVVGSRPAGDTAEDCDFLDPGDGSGLRAALEAARDLPGSQKVTVFVRRGVYDENMKGGGTP